MAQPKLWLALFLVVASPHALTADRVRERKAVVSPPPPPPPTEEPFARYKLNNLLGMHIFEGSAFVIGTQFGYAPIKGWSLYVGPEFSFSLYSPAHVSTLLGGAWVDVRLSQRLTFSPGVLGGVAFSEALPRIPPLVAAGYLDLVLAQEVDDLVSIRGQFRPGVVSRYFAFMLSLGVSFRLY